MTELLSTVRVVGIVTVALVTGLTGCSSHHSSATTEHPDATVDSGSHVTLLTGTVTDLTGAPVAGVTVSVGSVKATSGASGGYTLTGLSANRGALLAFSKDGYLPTSKPVDVVAGFTTEVDVVLASMAAPLQLDATKGGTVTGLRGATLTADPGVFLTSSGQAVSGQVDVHLTPLDPALSQERAAYPGVLVGASNGKVQGLLQTQGVLDVTVEQNGAALQIASGKTITVGIPGTVLGGLPAQSDLWSFDASHAYWNHEGTATLSGSFYTVHLPHLSFWNVDQVIGGGQAACLRGTVVQNGVQVGARVLPSAPGMSGESYGYFEPGSPYCVWVEPNTTVRLTATADGKSGSETVHAGSGEPYAGACQAATNCQTVPPIVIGQNPDGGPTTPSCTASSADAGKAGKQDAGKHDAGKHDAGKHDAGKGDAGEDDAGVQEGGAPNPFGDAGTCGTELMAFFACFNATGACSFSAGGGAADGGTMDIDFGSGASLELSPFGKNNARLTFYGPGKKECGTAFSNATTGDLDSTPAGSSGTFVMSQDAIECPNGDVIKLSQTQQSTMSGCQALGLGAATLGGCSGVGSGTCAGYPLPLVGSCLETDTSGVAITCSEYSGAYTVASSQKNCAAAAPSGEPAFDWRPGQGCPTTSLVGHCVWGCGTNSQRTNFEYPDPVETPAGQQSDCTTGSYGTWVP